MSVYLFVKLRAAEGAEEEVVDKMKWEAGETRKEAGCSRFDFLKNKGEDRVYHLYGIFNDQAALDAHMQADHFKEVWALKEAGKFSVEQRDVGTAVDV